MFNSNYYVNRASVLFEAGHRSVTKTPSTVEGSGNQPAVFIREF